MGTTITADIQAPQLHSTDPVQAGRLPSPFGSQMVDVGIKVPQAGTYTFSLRFWQDRSGPSVEVPNVTETFALGQVREEWGGVQCESADMQVQLPLPTTPPTKVICPAAYHA